MKLILQGDKIDSIETFHREIKTLLNLPEFYGANLDALWDCLTGWVSTPLTIIWINFELSKKSTGQFAEKALLVFKDAETEVPGFKIECK